MSWNVGDSRSINWPRTAGIAQLVEHNLAKVGVAGSSPVSRSVAVWSASDVATVGGPPSAVGAVGVVSSVG